MEKCPYHDKLASDVTSIGTDIALMKKDVEYFRRDQELILAKFLTHVSEADKEGGWHDRVRKSEVAVEKLSDSLATFRKFQLLYSAIGGIVGGLVGSKSPELIIEFLKSFKV